MQNLVIVESPTKARTLERYLGNGYQIIASMGHVRDLPKSEIGVDVEKNFEPQYIIPRDKRKRVNELKKTAAEAKTLWLATDPDREGEAIAWHIAELVGGRRWEDEAGKKRKNSNLQPPSPNLHRVVFHEITEDAIKDAFQHPRALDFKLVDAQQARRVLDRLVGYKLSPLLWQKVKRGLSAGRVQSVALRLIVEREREISAFKPVEYWIIEAELESAQGTSKNVILGSETTPESVKKDSGQARMTGDNSFVATLIEKDGKKLSINNEKEAKGHVANLEKADYVISKITKKEVRRYPSPPFTTSTLQQTASNRLGMSAKKTMMFAQALYERGLITYMRTDSFNLAPSAISSARSLISQQFGQKYLPSAPRFYKSRSKNVQEAHEAIRPTNVGVKTDQLKMGGLTRDHARLYDLIWKRFIACQMNEALMDQTTVNVTANPANVILGSEATPESNKGEDSGQARMTKGIYTLRATGSIIKFDGWLKLYGVQEEEETADGEGKKQVLPELSENEKLKLLQLLDTQHFTEPPPRYTEASLIKKLEELGIGRPSTYAPILSTIQERFYVERQERKFVPTALGFAVTDFLLKYFKDIIDYQFTAAMEDELDEISRGEREWKPTMKEFYTPFEKKLGETAEKAEHVQLAVEYAGKKCPECGKELIVRVGRYGKFLACSGFPDCKHTEAIEEIINAKCPQDGGEIVVRHTRKGKIFYGCKNWPGCKYASWTKPKG